MAYLRTKNIGGKEYYYLVKSVREGDTVRQITLKYIGPKEPSEKEVKRLKKKYEKKD